LCPASIQQFHSSSTALALRLAQQHGEWHNFRLKARQPQQEFGGRVIGTVGS